MGDHQNGSRDRTKSYQKHETVLEAQVQHPVADDDDRDELDVIGDDGHLAGSVSSEPRSFRKAMTREDAQRWVDAFAEEMAAHQLNGTWELV